MDYNKFEKNLIVLFKIFNDRPNHLAKFLMENKSFDKEFIELVIQSDKLNNIKDIDTEQMDFLSIDEMNDFYTELIKDDSDYLDMEYNLNQQLFELISHEQYEEAAKLRDYMNRKDIRIII